MDLRHFDPEFVREPVSRKLSSLFNVCACSVIHFSPTSGKPNLPIYIKVMWGERHIPSYRDACMRLIINCSIYLFIPSQLSHNS
jgi:hypothetical protein